MASADPMVRSGITNVMAWDSWGQDRLYRHSLADDDRCRLCHAAPGTQWHRSCECESWGPHHAKFLTGGLDQ
eukprot:4450503-Amphidinium_carterae.1